MPEHDEFIKRIKSFMKSSERLEYTNPHRSEELEAGKLLDAMYTDLGVSLELSKATIEHELASAQEDSLSSYQKIANLQFSQIAKSLPPELSLLIKRKTVPVVVDDIVYNAFAYGEKDGAPPIAIVFPKHYFFILNKLLKYNIAEGHPWLVFYECGDNSPIHPPSYYKKQFFSLIIEASHRRSVSQFDIKLTLEPYTYYKRITQLDIVELFAMGHEIGHVLINLGYKYFQDSALPAQSNQFEIELYADDIGFDIMKKAISKPPMFSDLELRVMQFEALSVHFLLQSEIEKRNPAGKHPSASERLTRVITSIFDKETLDIIMRLPGSRKENDYRQLIDYITSKDQEGAYQ